MVAVVTPEVLTAEAVASATPALATAEGRSASSHALKPAWHLLVGFLHNNTTSSPSGNHRLKRLTMTSSNTTSSHHTLQLLSNEHEKTRPGIPGLIKQSWYTMTEAVVMLKEMHKTSESDSKIFNHHSAITSGVLP